MVDRDDWNWATEEFHQWMNNEEALYRFMQDVLRSTDKDAAEELKSLAQDNLDTYGHCFYMDQDKIDTVDFLSIVKYNRED